MRIKNVTFSVHVNKAYNKPNSVNLIYIHYECSLDLDLHLHSNLSSKLAAIIMPHPHRTPQSQQSSKPNSRNNNNPRSRSTRNSVGATKGAASEIDTSLTQSQQAPLLNLLKSNLDICPSCENSVKTSHKGMACDDCGQWWHLDCTPETFSDEEYNLIGRSRFIKFKCGSCLERPDGEHDTSDPTNRTNTLLTKQMTQVMMMLSHMMDRLATIESNKKPGKEIEDLVKAEVREVMEENKEKEERKLNLVLVNLTENKAQGNPAEAKKEDTKKVTDLIKAIVPEEEGNEVEIEDLFRLGKPIIGTKSRMLKIKFKDEESKRKVQENAHKLRKINQNKEPKDCIFINPDYTQRERDLLHDLRKEVRERTNNGEKNLMVRNMKIVTKQPPPGGVDAEVHH